MSTSEFKSHLFNILNNLKSKIPVCIIRPSDGEYMILKGMKFNNIDNWHFSGNGRLKNDLELYIKIACGLHNCFIGIPCSCCNKDIGLWYKNNFNINQSNITFANLFCNGNWQVFIHFLKDSMLSLYVIGPQRKNISIDLNIKSYFEIPEYLVNSYDTESDNYYNKLRVWVEESEGPFFFACGPISKVWAIKLYQEFPTKSFLDIGSSFDIFIKGSTNRQYCNPAQIFSNRECYFE